MSLSGYYVLSDNGFFFVSTEEQADAMEQHISYPARNVVLRPEPGVELN